MKKLNQKDIETINEGLNIAIEKCKNDLDVLYDHEKVEKKKLNNTIKNIDDVLKKINA